ncbi:MAG: hypothetical protein R3A48_13880 [Polyangiales bacterium]
MRQAEVEDLREIAAAAAVREQDVVALQVAVHHAEVVRATERRRHLLEHVDRPREGERPLGDLRRERRADEVLHHEVELALLGLADVVNVDDVRVVDAVRGAGLAEHPRAQVGLAAEVGANELERDDAVNQHVSGAVDHAHAALAQPRFEPIPPRDDPTKIRVRCFLLRGHQSPRIGRELRHRFSGREAR